MYHTKFYGILLICLGFWSCQTESKTEPSSPPQHKNISSDNDTLVLSEAQNFEMWKQSDSTWSLQIMAPWKGAAPKEYILYPAQTKAHNPAAIVLPAQRIVCTGTSSLAFLAELNALDKVVGVAQGNYVYHPSIQEGLHTQQIQEVSTANGLDLEKIVALQPDLVLAFSRGDDASYARLEKLGIPTILLAEFLEKTPLGRAEWLKLIGVLIGEEEKAKKHFTSIEAHYQQLRQRAAQDTNHRPKVILSLPYQGVWYIPGGASYMAQYIKDAGGLYPWANNQETGSLPLDFEAVYTQAADADIWLDVLTHQSLSELKAQDERLALFKAYKTQHVFSYTKRISPKGGFDVFEQGVARPDKVLADLFHILQAPTPIADSLYFYEALRAQ